MKGAGFVLLAAALAVAWAPRSMAEPAAGLALVPEMETPEGIVAQPRRERLALKGRAEAERGLERLKARVAERWPEIRGVDLVALSRHHVEETRGFRLPAEPGALAGRAIGRDAEGRWFLELRGPRLPARYDVVHRYLYVFARYHPTTGELDRLTLTIRGWVLE